MNEIVIRNIIDLIALPIMLALSVYHFLIYRGRKRYTEEHYNLYFSLFTLFLTFYLFLNTVSFINSETAWKYRDWLPPLEGTLIFLLFFNFTVFFSKLIKFPDDQTRLLKFLNIFLLVSLSFTFISFIKGWYWYNLHIGRLLIFSTAFYVLAVFYLFGRQIIKAKLYKNKTIKIIIFGTAILILYLLGSKIVQAFRILQILQRNNLIITGIVYGFAYALAAKFNREYDELVLLKNNLEQKVTERTAELTKAKKQIEEAKEQIELVSSERTNFFVNLAHETKTPLTIISNYLEKYINKYGTNEEIGIIKKNIDKLCKDMVDFLEVEKLLKGVFPYDNNQVTDVSKLVDDKVYLFKEYACKNNIVLSADVEKCLYIKSDPKLLDRIIFNLVENAIKYSIPGGKIDIKLFSTDNNIIFTVADTGIGIPEEKLTHIFEPYYQISHKKLNNEGMGMGLYIVKRSVEFLNGSIDVKSTENEGSSFTICLPLHVPAEDEKIISYSAAKFITPDQKVIEREIAPGKNSILIVEDNVDMLNYLTEELTGEYNVYMAKNGMEAIKVINNISIPGLIISDIMMDQMDGEEFFNKISSDDNYRNIPFIFLTARAEQNEKIRMLQSGAIDYINKPFSISELKARIKTIIGNSERQKREGLKKAIDVINKELSNPDKSAPDKYQIFNERCKRYELTERQKEIAYLVAEGLEYKEIADKLNISYRTVTNHIENLFDKLGIHNKVDLINLLFR